ncbi:MAG: HNH endonuclease [Proteobacteria bacterium]|nr:HNH endonuclease [Pseudomonadota bacterium]
MKYWVGVTDNDWYRYLSRIKPDEVNFWRPGGKTGFSAIEPGCLFLFKLKNPHNHIAGGGFFVQHSTLPLSIAWQVFQEKNGSSNFTNLHDVISALRRDQESDPAIGCSLLANPFFLPERDWIPVPENWAKNIVQGKTYDTRDYHGSRLFEAVQGKLQSLPKAKTTLGQPGLVADETPLYGSEFLARARLGQGAFKILVTETYKRRCAVTGKRTLPVLEAAHIKPFSEKGPNSLNNGLLLRSDVHLLFDKGFMTITDSFNIEVSRKLKEQFENGIEYYSLHGKRLEVLPKKQIERPSKEFIHWHNNHKYKG